MKHLLIVVAFAICIADTMAQNDEAGTFENQPSHPVLFAPVESVGLSAERLERIEAVMRPYVEQGLVAGLMTAVARRGRLVHFESYGYRDLEAEKPMEHETIFRIYSMTKPVTSVAVLMLYEEGRFLLTDPVARYIPAFEGLQVYDAAAPDGSKRARLSRPVTIRDLLTHTSGLTYGFGQTPVDTLYREAELLYKRDDRGVSIRHGTMDDMVMKLSRIPLLHQPGTRWQYSVSFDVLGHLVEVVSGQTLDVFFQERIFDPLGMPDTGFEVPPEKMDRFAVNYTIGGNGRLEILDAGSTSIFAAPVEFFSGGGGLVSTMTDYLRFAQMLLNGGVLGGTRLLSPKTVELMTSNHLKPGDETTRPGYGYGLGVAVLTNVARTQSLGSKGNYGWAGFANTYFFIDREEELIGMVWSQHFPWRKYPIAAQFKVAVYQAIVD